MHHRSRLTLAATRFVVAVTFGCLAAGACSESIKTDNFDHILPCGGQTLPETGVPIPPADATPGPAPDGRVTVTVSVDVATNNLAVAVSSTADLPRVWVDVVVRSAGHSYIDSTAGRAEDLSRPISFGWCLLDGPAEPVGVSVVVRDGREVDGGVVLGRGFLALVRYHDTVLTAPDFDALRREQLDADLAAGRIDQETHDRLVAELPP